MRCRGKPREMPSGDVLAMHPLGWARTSKLPLDSHLHIHIVRHVSHDWGMDSVRTADQIEYATMA